MKDVQEALKEAGRVGVLAVIPVIIASLMTNTLDIHVLEITAAIAFLRGIDKWLHETDRQALPF